VSVGLFGKTCLGDGGGNYGRSASSRTLGSWCVDGAWTGKLFAVVSREINVLLCAPELVSEIL